MVRHLGAPGGALAWFNCVCNAIDGFPTMDYSHGDLSYVEFDTSGQFWVCTTQWCATQCVPVVNDEVLPMFCGLNALIHFTIDFFTPMIAVVSGLLEISWSPHLGGG